MTNHRNQLTTPVLLLVFNRPDKTSQVFQAIRAIRPARLFVAADGPRPHILDENIKCDKVKNIVTSIDWECEIHTLFREENLGCRKAVSTAIDWFFDHVDKGIILEDDCLPSQSFFLFCHELLNTYEKNEKVMHISGYNPHQGKTYGTASYYFSIYNLIWGWATWKQAWKHYNDNIKDFQHHLNNGTVKKLFPQRKENTYFTSRFKDTFQGHIDSWGYIWLYSRLLQGGIAIHPNRNLIQNIGFSKDATHTKTVRKKLIGYPTGEISFPLTHPQYIAPDRDADSNIFRSVHCPNYYLFRLSQVFKPVTRILCGEKT